MFNKPNVTNARINSDGYYYLIGSSRMARVDPNIIESYSKKETHNIKLDGVDIEILNKSLIRIAFKPSIINEGEIIEKIYTSGSKIKSINSKEPDLEDLFLELTNNDAN